MRFWILVVLFVMLASTVYGAAIDFAVEGDHLRTINTLGTKVTGNTVSANTTAMVVTFNTAVSDLLLINEGTLSNIHVTINPNTSPQVTVQNISSLGVLKLSPLASATINARINKIGYICETQGSGQLQYYAVSENSTQP